MEFTAWRQALEGSNLPVSADDYNTTASSYMTVEEDVSLASEANLDFKVLDRVKLEFISNCEYESDKIIENGVKRYHCLKSPPDILSEVRHSLFGTGHDFLPESTQPSLELTRDLLDTELAEFGLNLSEIDSILADRGACRSDTDSGITSDSESACLEDIDLVLHEMKMSKDSERFNHNLCHTDDRYHHDVVNILSRFEDSHMPIKKRRRAMESYNNYSLNVITSDHHVSNNSNCSSTNTIPPILVPSKVSSQFFFMSSDAKTKNISFTGASTPEGHPQRKKPGRKPGQCSKGYHLWEFMRDLLNNSETCPRDVMWVDRENGIFRICDSSNVARLWGDRKNNKKLMTYEKLSRALRFSRTAGYFSDLPKDAGYPRKLCFKFGPKTPYGHRIKLESCS